MHITQLFCITLSGNHATFDWLMNIETSLWARHAYDTNVKIDHCTNKCSESFNSWVDPFGGYFVLNILESIRTQLMQRMTVRRGKGIRNKEVGMPS